jgi:hypothetical protein
MSHFDYPKLQSTQKPSPEFNVPSSQGTHHQASDFPETMGR